MLHSLETLPAALPPETVLLGLDVGTKTLGMAVSDPGLLIASPIGTLRRRKFSIDVQDLAAVCRERSVAGFVIGLPVNMDGSAGPAAQSVRQFARNLMAEAALFGQEPQIAFWDERLSTRAVERILIDEADMSRRRRAQVVDAMAAAYILQGALDAIRARRAPSGPASDPDR